MRLRLKEYGSEYERGIKRERERGGEIPSFKMLEIKKEDFFFLPLLLLLTKTTD